MWRHELSALVYAVAMSPDGKTVASACQDKLVYLIDTQTRAVRVLRGHDDQVLSLAFSPDGKQLASGDYSGLIRLWNPRSTRPAGKLSGHTSAVWSLSFNQQGTRLASGSSDKTVRC